MAPRTQVNSGSGRAVISKRQGEPFPNADQEAVERLFTQASFK